MLESIFHRKRISQDNYEIQQYRYSLFSKNDPFESLLMRRNEFKIKTHKVKSIENIQNFAMPESHKEKLREESPYKEMTDEGIKEYFIEFKKYLAIIVLVQGNDKKHSKIAMMNNLIDDIWHNFILFSEDYDKFTRSAFGKYLHHQPFQKYNETVDTSKKKFLFYYKKYFGRVNPIWKFRYVKDAALSIGNFQFSLARLSNYPIFNNIRTNMKNEDVFYEFFNHEFIVNHNLEYDWENNSYWIGFWNDLNEYAILY